MYTFNLSVTNLVLNSNAYDVTRGVNIHDDI
jgi:hypothetical protein